MKLNLIFGIMLLMTVMIISAVNAVDLTDNLINDNFEIDIPSGSDFKENAKINDDDESIIIFENSANNSEDVNSIVYIRDYENEPDDWFNDLSQGATKVEETDKYTVFKVSDNVLDFVTDNFDIFDVFDNPLSSFLNRSLSLFSDNFEISDSDDADISISTDGINVSSDSDDETVSISGDLNADMKDSDYCTLLKNSENNEYLIILGDNLELLKSMANTTTFNEN